MAIPEAPSTKAKVHQMDESGEGAVRPKGVTPLKLTEAHLPEVRSLEVALPRTVALPLPPAKEADGAPVADASSGEVRHAHLQLLKNYSIKSKINSLETSKTSVDLHCLDLSSDNFLK